MNKSIRWFDAMERKSFVAFVCMSFESHTFYTIKDNENLIENENQPNNKYLCTQCVYILH